MAGEGVSEWSEEKEEEGRIYLRFESKKKEDGGGSEKGEEEEVEIEDVS